MSPIHKAAFCSLFLVLPALACAEEMAPVALNSLSAAPGNIAAAKVVDQNGNALGQAERIQTDQYGKPSALAFRANNGSTVVIGAAAVSFDGTLLVASNDQPQVAALTAPRIAAAN
jgi:hypothetical protein